MIPVFDGLLYLFGLFWFLVGAACGTLATVAIVLMRSATLSSRWEDRRDLALTGDELSKRRRVG